MWTFCPRHPSHKGTPGSQHKDYQYYVNCGRTNELRTYKWSEDVTLFVGKYFFLLVRHWKSKGRLFGRWQLKISEIVMKLILLNDRFRAQMILHVCGDGWPRMTCVAWKRPPNIFKFFPVVIHIKQTKIYIFCQFACRFACHWGAD